MIPSDLCRLIPTVSVLAEAIPGCILHQQDAERSYEGVRVFHENVHLREEILYLIPKGKGPSFPRDRYSYLTTEDLPGLANHIFCPGWEETPLLDTALGLFSWLRQQEILLDRLLYQNTELSAFCEAAAQILGNPVYLHDDWFITLAMSAQAREHMPPEYILSSSNGFVPQAILDDFKFDNEYLETYDHHSPQIWENTGQGPRSLYVNLWEGTIYRGRLLVFETNHTFRKRDFLVARMVAQHAMELLRKRHPGGDQAHSMDDLVFQLLQGSQPDPIELNQMLRSLGWSSEDQFTVIRLQSQQGSSSAMEHLLHTDLFLTFTNCYILLRGHQQCLVLNLTRQMTNLATIRHTLAPLCRDYCLYAGISSPVTGVRELHFAYVQSGIALNEAFQLRNEKWILPFSDCALDYWFEHLSGDLKTRHLVSPELLYLRQFDRDNGTEYYATLREYLLQERNIPRTSEKLIVHRTTLLYRLKKIQSLVSLDLDNQKSRLHLLLSLEILEGQT